MTERPDISPEAEPPGQTRRRKRAGAKARLRGKAKLKLAVPAETAMPRDSATAWSEGVSWPQALRQSAGRYVPPDLGRITGSRWNGG